MNNEMLVAEINLCRNTRAMTSALGKMFIELVNNYRSKQFKLIAEYDDMKAHAVLTLTRTWFNYDPAKDDNMVAVFNAVIHAACISWLATEQKEAKLSQQLRDLIPDE